MSQRLKTWVRRLVAKWLRIFVQSFAYEPTLPCLRFHPVNELGPCVVNGPAISAFYCTWVDGEIVIILPSSCRLLVTHRTEVVVHAPLHEKDECSNSAFLFCEEINVQLGKTSNFLEIAKRGVMLREGGWKLHWETAGLASPDLTWRQKECILQRASRVRLRTVFLIRLQDDNAPRRCTNCSFRKRKWNNLAVSFCPCGLLSIITRNEAGAVDISLCILQNVHYESQLSAKVVQVQKVTWGAAYSCCSLE